MKSYPLLQEVMVELNFDVSLFREGDIKTTEYYDTDFPVQFVMVGKKQYGKRYYFEVTSDDTYRIQPAQENDEQLGANRDNLRFGDTVQVNGDRLARR